MRSSLFRPGESVLLLGEGNFSFSVGLVNLNLALKITSTCLESHVELVKGQENIEYLKEKGVRILLGVDATKLAQHHILGNETYSKIVFNFPHVGGKMKIHLNRELLRQFCKSSSLLLDAQGQVLISLCKGQGGTGADCPLRRWDDTWQVVEMAAHGDLVLTDIEPFVCDNFPNYTSVGYRSRDTAFHTDGALVHIFSKRDNLYPTMAIGTLMNYLDLEPLETNFGTIKCCHVYASKYKNSVLGREGSPSQVLCRMLGDWLCAQHSAVHKECLSVKHVSDVEVPLHREDSQGSFISIKKYQELQCELRHSLLDVLDSVLHLWEKDPTDIVMFPGLIFNSLEGDFSCPPVSSQVLLLGDKVAGLCMGYIKHSLQTVKKSNMLLTLNYDVIAAKSELYHDSDLEIIVKCNFVMSHEAGCEVGHSSIVAQELSIKERDGTLVEGCLIHMDTLAIMLFHLEGWRQLWAEGTHIVFAQHAIMAKLASLYPPIHMFDVCMTDSPPHTEQDLYNILWQVAADVITNLELLEVYNSPFGWRTKCYRITYQSCDKALFRKRAINIHHDVIGKTLCGKLGVTIS